MSKQPVILSNEDREQVNRDLRDAAWEQRDEQAPPRLPRLSKPPSQEGESR